MSGKTRLSVQDFHHRCLCAPEVDIITSGSTPKEPMMHQPTGWNLCEDNYI